MATTVDFSWELPYEPEALFQQGMRRDFIEEMAAATGQRKLEIRELEDGPEGGHALARYQVELDIPSWAKKFVPAHNMVNERRTWGAPAADGSRSYNVSIKLDNVPLTIEGVVGLLVAGSGTTNTVHFDITAQVAIFGKKLEEMSEADVRRSCELQRDFMLQWMKTRA